MYQDGNSKQGGKSKQAGKTEQGGKTEVSKMSPGGSTRTHVYFLVLAHLDVWGRLFRTKSVMGRLWDDDFMHLGHPPKFYRVQHVGFIDGSSS